MAYALPVFSNAPPLFPLYFITFFLPYLTNIAALSGTMEMKPLHDDRAQNGNSKPFIPSSQRMMIPGRNRLVDTLLVVDIYK